MITFDMKNKSAIVTGATSGIGKATAIAFAKAGTNVAVIDLNQEKADLVAKELEEFGIRSFGYALDVRSFESQQKAVKQTVEKFGTLDYMINCAGIGGMYPISELTETQVNDIIDIDLKGVIFGSKAAVEVMLPNKSGKIVNVSSIAGIVGYPMVGVYGAAKAGINTFTASLAREVGPHNINVNGVMPGTLRTNMWEETLIALAGDDMEKRAEIFAEYTKDIPLGRPQEVEDIANMILYLCSDEAKNITAQTFTIDGGITF